MRISTRTGKLGLGKFCRTFVLEQETGTVQGVAILASAIGHHPNLSKIQNRDSSDMIQSGKFPSRGWLSRLTLTTSIGLLVAEQQKPANPLAARCVGRPSWKVPG